MTDNTAPERIWLQTGGDYATYHNVSAEDEEQITWCWHKVEDDDQEYVRVDLYEAALADLQAENKELRDALHEIASTICDCREGPDCPAPELVKTAHQALKGDVE